MFGYKWWAAQHISGGEWFAWNVLTLFGYPLTTMFFRVVGPYKHQQDALKLCDEKNKV